MYYQQWAYYAIYYDTANTKYNKKQNMSILYENKVYACKCFEKLLA